MVLLLSPTVFCSGGNAGGTTVSPTPALINRKNSHLLHSQSPLLHKPFSSTKRTLAISLLLFTFPTPSLLSLPASSPSPLLIPSTDHQFQWYTDRKEGFSLLTPSSWIKIEKAGATALFEEVSGRGNNIGVVVTPVRLRSLGDFGSPQFVAEKLIQAEKKKESTKDAEVIGFSERSGAGGLQVYEFEYIVDSSRGGMKRIFSAAFVASRKLYLLNISYSDPLENPIDTQKRAMLEQVLHSFDVATSST